MAKRRRQRAREVPGYDAACEVLETALKGRTRAEILDRALAPGEGRAALDRLRKGMRSHVFETAEGTLALDGLVRGLDRKTRQEGFHVLLEWDHAAHRFLDEEVPVLLLDYYANMGGGPRPLREAMALLLDVYFVYVLGLFVMRAWDEGDPNRNLDRVTALLGHLGGANGSGRRLVECAETLLFVAISHYEPDDLAYHRLLHRIWDLDEDHRERMAMITAPVFGSHLRWGFPALYERDLVRMRDDNFSDYPWLFFSVATLMRGYARLREKGVGREARSDLAGALLNGLTPDPWAFVGDPPASLSEYLAEHAEFQRLFERWQEDLLDEFGEHRPVKGLYSPIGFHFNFPHNALIAMVVITLLGEDAPNLPFDALFARELPGSLPEASPEPLAYRITEYAIANPERRNGRRVLMIAYDTGVAIRSYTRTLGVLRNGPEIRAGNEPGKAAGDRTSAPDLGSLAPVEGAPPAASREAPPAAG